MGAGHAAQEARRVCVRVREARGPRVGLTAAAPRPMQIKTGKGVSSPVDGITRLVTLMTPAALHACGPERHGSASQQGLEPKRYTPRCWARPSRDDDEASCPETGAPSRRMGRAFQGKYPLRTRQLACALCTRLNPAGPFPGTAHGGRCSDDPRGRGRSHCVVRLVRLLAK
jgi:hypothetical protein